MNSLSLFYVQIGIDILMCGLMLYFLWRVGKITAVPRRGDELTLQELGRLITESQQSARQFLEALAEGRKALKEISYSLDEKGARLQSLCLRAESLEAGLKKEEPEGNDAASSPVVDHEQVLRMAAAGASVPEIVRHTGLTEGEVHLIIDLARSRDKNR